MNILFICVLVATLIALIYIFITTFKLIQEHKLEPVIINLITEAEEKYESGEGSKKFEYVFDKLYNTFAPKIVKLLDSANKIQTAINT